MADTMKAWQFTSASGGLEKNLILNESATPPPKTSLQEDDVLVEVISASINPVDYKIPEMGLVGKMAISTPASPGLDFCGRVAATHGSNDTLQIGQKVFGRLEKPTKYGTCGQFIIASVGSCVPLPEGVGVDAAAAVGTAGLTAYQALTLNMKVGSKVFINGGSGGTGTWGIQFARAMNADVVTSCSSANVELCKSLGATEVIDYTKSDLIERLKAMGTVFDLVVDNVGLPTPLYKECHHFLKPSGKFVQIGASASFNSAINLASRMLQPGFLGGGHRPFVFWQAKQNREHLVEIGRLLAEGKVRAIFEHIFDWEDVPKAYQKLKTGRARGKIVVHITES